MSPRDEFAAAALQGLLGTCVGRVPEADMLARSAYAIADEMIRQGKPEPDGFKEFAHELLACVVADTFVEMQAHGPGYDLDEVDKLHECIKRLEVATRSSTLRKVRP